MRHGNLHHSIPIGARTAIARTCPLDPNPFIEKPRCVPPFRTRTRIQAPNGIPRQTHPQSIPKRNKPAFHQHLRSVATSNHDFSARGLFMKVLKKWIARGNHARPSAVFVRKARADEVPVDIRKLLAAVIPTKHKRIEFAAPECAEILGIPICPRERDDGDSGVRHVVNVPCLVPTRGVEPPRDCSR